MKSKEILKIFFQQNFYLFVVEKNFIKNDYLALQIMFLSFSISAYPIISGKDNIFHTYLRTEPK